MLATYSNVTQFKSLGLLLGTETAVMTPNGVDFPLPFFVLNSSQQKWGLVAWL